MRALLRSGVQQFQSTPLMRGETAARTERRSATTHFNPLPSCEGRHEYAPCAIYFFDISIHSPHARGDPVMAQFHGFDTISIHSPHARGDPQDG